MNEDAVREKKIAYNIAFLFTLMGALLIFLSPQFLGPIVGVIFIIPIYIGLNGIKGRKKVGYYLALGIVPIASAVSVLWIRYYFSLESVAKEILEVSVSQGIPKGFLSFMIYGSFIGSAIELIISVTVLYLLLSNKNIFKSIVKRS